ncbi:MAG: bifunctional 4-hydroxy-2-oxoglutarate aldolase/2-dehydro-3-deoxy-phosphogluconate aldolase [Hungatella sp.]|jgi:2-dehydro-3-deoxyphosphogluconate aldolase/(4S)-4-hydroxy-2-oxoglutarate aldolase|nr:bifunctional 4-hydroxy-2-oxoglutarate aldolase/2-dehydro-3-deoxy-phosphogluconate aldolase [Hungatella sp.]
MRRFLQDNKICAILRNIPLEETLSYARVVYEGGVGMFEVATNSSEALKQIALLKEEFGDDVAVGAGTAVTVELVKEAANAGAQFFLTPSASVPVLSYCREHELPLLPGVLTPTEVDLCIQYGFTLLKLFPAGDMPPGYIKSLKGPFDQTDYVAVGGVSPDNIEEFFQYGFVGVGIGSNLIPKQYREAGKWDEAREYVRTLVNKA